MLTNLHEQQTCCEMNDCWWCIVVLLLWLGMRGALLWQGMRGALLWQGMRGVLLRQGMHGVFLLQCYLVAASRCHHTCSQTYMNNKHGVIRTIVGGALL